MEQERKYDEEAAGRDLPTGDGGVGDEQVNAITDDGKGKETGHDHSTKREDAGDDEGVGGVQRSSDTTSDVARIRD